MTVHSGPSTQRPAWHAAASELARESLRSAILHAGYTNGDALPSSRDLAERFHINRNTANKIYKELEDEGLVETRSKGRPVVIATARPASAFNLHDRLHAAMLPVLHEAQLHGVPRSELSTVVANVLTEFFNAYRPPRLVTVECSALDASRHARQISAVLGCQVKPVVLPDLGDAVAADLIVVPWFHADEVMKRLGGPDPRVERVLTAPAMDDVSQLLTRVGHGPVGVVAANPPALERLTSFLRFHLQVPFVVATLDDVDGLLTVVRQAEVIACTSQSRPEVDRAGGGERAITIRYIVHDESLAALRKRLAAIPSSGAPSVGVRAGARTQRRDSR